MNWWRSQSPKPQNYGTTSGHQTSASSGSPPTERREEQTRDRHHHPEQTGPPHDTRGHGGEADGGGVPLCPLQGKRWVEGAKKSVTVAFVKPRFCKRAVIFQWTTCWSTLDTETRRDYWQLEGSWQEEEETLSTLMTKTQTRKNTNLSNLCQWWDSWAKHQYNYEWVWC